VSPRLVCVGTAVVDLVADLAGPLAVGAKQFVPALRTAVGGPATTAAAAAARFGLDVRLVAPVGDDERAATIRAALAAAGVGDALVVRPGAATATSLVLVTPDGERTIVNATSDALRGPLYPDAAAALRADVAGADAVLADVRWPAAAALALAAARAAGVPGVLDLDRAPAGDGGLVAGLVRAASHVAASTDGLDDLLAAQGVPAWTDADPAAALAALRGMTDGATVLVTLGAAGTARLEDGALRTSATPPVAAVETRGADVWHGVFAGGLAAGRTVADAVADANAAAALRCTRRGGWETLADAAEVAALRAQERT
jgi:sulfofructose kinase